MEANKIIRKAFLTENVIRNTKWEKTESFGKTTEILTNISLIVFFYGNPISLWKIIGTDICWDKPL